MSVHVVTPDQAREIDRKLRGAKRQSGRPGTATPLSARASSASG